MWTENGCTDILAVPDAGVIKLLQDDFHNRIDTHLEENFDRWFSSSRPDSVERRRVMIKFIGASWARFEEVHGCGFGHESVVTKLAYKTGNLFKLDKDPVKQFERCVFRGYDKKDKDGVSIPRSPWDDMTLDLWRKNAHVRRKKNNKRKLKGGALTFANRKKKTEAAMLLLLEEDVEDKKDPL